MVNGRMCCGVLKTDLVLRLAPEEAATSLRQPHTRPMIYVSAIGTDSDQALATWVGSAVRLARNAPEKRSAPRSVREHRTTSSGSAAPGSAILESASKRAARKRG
jgi:hypothetical protein